MNPAVRVAVTLTGFVALVAGDIMLTQDPKLSFALFAVGAGLFLTSIISRFGRRS